MDKSGLLNYVEQHASDLLLKVKIGAPSIAYLNKMLSVKGETTLNLLNTNVTLRRADCKFEDGDGVILSQRTMKAQPLVVNQTYCESDLEGTWMQYDLLWKAGVEKLPYSEKFAEDLVLATSSEIEKQIWQGGIIEGFTNYSSDYNTVTSTSESLYDTVMTIIDSFTPVIYKNKPTIYMGTDLYSKFLRSLSSIGAVIYGNIATDAGLPSEIIVPFSQNVKAVSIPGLNGTGEIYGTYQDNLFYGTDIEDAMSSVDFWYSKDNQQYRAAIKFVAGTQVAFPDLVWYYKQA